MGGIHPRQEAGSLHLLAVSLAPGCQTEGGGTNAVTPQGGEGEMGESSKVGPEAPSSCAEIKDTKSRMRSEVWVEALWGGQRPSPQSTKKGVSSEEGSA